MPHKTRICLSAGFSHQKPTSEVSQDSLPVPSQSWGFWNESLGYLEHCRHCSSCRYKAWSSPPRLGRAGPEPLGALLQGDNEAQPAERELLAGASVPNGVPPPCLGFWAQKQALRGGVDSPAYLSKPTAVVCGRRQYVERVRSVGSQPHRLKQILAPMYHP